MASKNNNKKIWIVLLGLFLAAILLIALSIMIADGTTPRGTYSGYCGINPHAEPCNLPY